MAVVAPEGRAVMKRKPADDQRHAAAAYVAGTSREWQRFVDHVTRAIKDAGFKQPNPRTPFATKAIDAAVREAEAAFSEALDGDGDYSRALHLGRVTRAMIEIERVKLGRDPAAWLARHFTDLEPKRKAA